MDGPPSTPGDETPGGGGQDTGSTGIGGTDVVPMPPMTDGPLDVGTKVIHRLSNGEYNNTVRDLLGTTSTPADAFVHEDSEDGFENLAEALGMSGHQFNDYFDAAEALAAEAFANPAQLAAIVPCDLAADAACADQVITSFGARAFRRPLEEWEASQLLGKYQEAVTLGETPVDAMRQVVHIMLFSPQFLYRMEIDPDPAAVAPRALGGYELASRLSYMMWGSMPDSTLFGLAESGALLSPDTLVAEVDRMLADGKAQALIESFAGQWLGARELVGHTADPAVFPSWDAALPVSMRAEMDQYFAEFLFGDRPMTEFLTADLHFVDARLAEHYGVAAPASPRVEGATPERNGLLGLAGFLTATSKANRTSPIARGHIVLDSILCVKLTLPPDLVVGDLPELTATTTVRDQLEQHRADPACAPCHNQMDPIGLALEKFDGVGSYREVYENGLPVDAQGAFADGTEFDGLLGLNQVLAADPRSLACTATKLFSYGLGRRVGTSKAYVDQIVANWQATGSPTLRNLLKELVRNDTFRFRRGETN